MELSLAFGRLQTALREKEESERAAMLVCKEPPEEGEEKREKDEKGREQGEQGEQDQEQVPTTGSPEDCEEAMLQVKKSFYQARKQLLSLVEKFSELATDSSCFLAAQASGNTTRADHLRKLSEVQGRILKAHPMIASVRLEVLELAGFEQALKQSFWAFESPDACSQSEQWVNYRAAASTLLGVVDEASQEGPSLPRRVNQSIAVGSLLSLSTSEESVEAAVPMLS